MKSETTQRTFCTEFSCAAEKTLVLNVSVLSCSDFIRDADFCTEFSCVAEKTLVLKSFRSFLCLSELKGFCIA